MPMGRRFYVTILALLCCGATVHAHAQPASASDELHRYQRLITDAKASMIVDPARAVDQAYQARQRALSLPQTPDKPMMIATAGWMQGEAYLRLSDFRRALPLINSAYVIAVRDQKPSKLLGDVLISKGVLASNQPDAAAALSYFQRAYNVFRKIGDDRSQAIALVNIATLYNIGNNFEIAVRYYKQALEIYDGDAQFLISVYNNRGINLKELRKYAEAKREFDTALNLSHELRSVPLEIQVLRNIARNFLEGGKLEQADHAIFRGMALSANEKSDPSRVLFLGIAAQAALQHGQLAKAKHLIDAAFFNVDIEHTNPAFQYNHRTAYEIYKAAGQPEKALAHLEALKRINDEATKLASSTNTALMAARFDYANQNLKIARLKAETLQRNVELERTRARTQRIIFSGIVLAAIAGVLLLAASLLIIWRSRNEVKAANVELEATNAALGKALSAKTEFLATTSHEIRTPLNGILGMTQVMLADAALAEPVRDRIGVVHGAGLTMRALVDDILDVAKMETGNLVLEKIRFDLPATLRDVSRLWEEQARARGIDFVLDIARCPECIIGDSARIRQLVFNLLSNAMKFTSQGSVTIRATTTEDDRLAIAVADTGIGIPVDKQADIFESFRQVDASTTRQFGGTGLGLTICRNLARAMGGEVSVKSAPGQGSEFLITLPLVRPAEPEGIEPADAQPPALLIIDNNPISRSMLRAVFEKRAERVVFAAGAKDACTALANDRVSRVLIDEATIKAEPAPMTALARIAGRARAVDARAAVMWTRPEEAERKALAATGIEMIAAKPIAAVELMKMLYPDPASEAPGAAPVLTSQAA